MFGTRLRQLRVAKGWTQTALARHIGVTQKRVSQWENGVCRPADDAFLKLCEALGVDRTALDVGAEPAEPTERRTPRRGRPKRKAADDEQE